MSESSEEVILTKLEIAERMLLSGSSIDFVVETTKLTIDIIQTRLPALFEYQRGFEYGKAITEKNFLDGMVRNGLTNEQIYRITGLDKYVIRRANYLVKKSKKNV